jgi:photosystem II stability/assembly factor-like uncharacterized protein
MKKILSAVGILASLQFAQQPGKWEATHFNYAANVSRVNDIFFLNPALGWAVNGIGQIHKTTDGGITWTKQFDKTKLTHFRSVGFVDSLTGFAGALGWGDSVGHPNDSKDTAILYKTTDGGLTWLPEPHLTSGTVRRGFCGMQVFNDSILYAVGRVRGPAWFYKSTDRGQTWRAKDMNGYAAGLVDVYFHTRDSGFAVGLTNVTHAQSQAIILKTANGGDTWDTSYVATRTNEWAWKITFPSRKTGYVSLQRDGGLSPVYILKTTDGGMTWTPKLFSSTGYFVQGIGFLNDSLGWAGGSSLQPKQTTDGGETWVPLAIGNSLNRFRKINDSLMYVSGAGVWKYSAGASMGIHKKATDAPGKATWNKSFSIPFNPETKVRFPIPEAGFVTVSVYNLKGALTRTLFAGYTRQKSITLSWDGRNDADEEVPNGRYVYRLQTKGSTETEMMNLVR